jgi:hypothetical protein
MVRGEERVLIRDEHRYCAHPHMAVLASGAWLLVATCGPRRAVTMHPPQDPEYINLMIRSFDQGETWSAPAAVPGYGYTGAECAGLTALPNGAALLNQWRFRWYPCQASPSARDEPMLRGPAELVAGLAGSYEIAPPALTSEAPERLMPWARGGGALSVYRSEDDGARWSAASVVDTAPYSGGYGMRGCLAMPDGDIVLPLSDVPHYARIFAVRSIDGGRSWAKPEPVAASDGREFEEPAPLLLADGTILMLLRDNVSHTLFEVHSLDGGHSWSAPEATGIDCYPAHLLALPDGRLAAVCGRRHPPYGISVFFSCDRGRRWDVETPLRVRTDLPNKDLGYPTAALRSDGSLFVAYYYRDAVGVTGVYAKLLSI